MPETLQTGRRAAALPPAERRAAIIDAITPLVVERGDALTTREIASAAGIAEGTIFRVFADKDELFAATVEAVLDPASFEAAIAAIDPDLSFEDRLAAAAEIVEDRILRVWRLLSNVRPRLREHAARPLADSPALTALFESERHRLRMDPPQAARTLRALALSLTHPMLSVEPMSPAEVVRLLLRGIEADR